MGVGKAGKMPPRRSTSGKGMVELHPFRSPVAQHKRDQYSAVEPVQVKFPLAIAKAFTAHRLKEFTTLPTEDPDEVGRSSLIRGDLLNIVYLL
jgi:hypothetical protein